jgi:hypothetical protein
LNVAKIELKSTKELERMRSEMAQGVALLSERLKAIQQETTKPNQARFVPSITPGGSGTDPAETTMTNPFSEANERPR